jgi:hypothetical protein
MRSGGATHLSTASKPPGLNATNASGREIRSKTMNQLFDIINNVPADLDTIQYVEECKHNASKVLKGEALDEYLKHLLDALGLEEKNI